MAISALGGIAHGCCNCTKGTPMNTTLATTLAILDILASVGLALLAAYGGKFGYSETLKIVLMAGAAFNALMILYANIVPIHKSLTSEALIRKQGGTG